MGILWDEVFWAFQTKKRHWIRLMIWWVCPSLETLLRGDIAEGDTELEGVYKKSEDCCIWDKLMDCIIWMLCYSGVSGVSVTCTINSCSYSFSSAYPIQKRDWSLSQQAQDERQYASRTGCQSITGLCCMRFLIQMILTIAGAFRGRYVSLHSVYLQMPEKLLTKLSILSVSSSYILQSTCERTWSSCTYSHAVSLIDVSVLTMLSLFCAWMLPFFACWDSEHIFQMW